MRKHRALDQSRHPVYAHASILKLHLQCANQQPWEPHKLLAAAVCQPHPHITLAWCQERGYKDFGRGTVTVPLEVKWNGRYLAIFDWKKRRLNDVRGKGNQPQRAGEVVAYLSLLLDLPLQYRQEAQYVEVCCFVERSFRSKLLSVARMMDEHFALARSQKRVDYAYNGVSECFLSGELQLAKREPTFRVKLYEAIQCKPVGFKPRQAPKLEIQVSSKGSWEEATAFASSIVMSLLGYTGASTIQPKHVCIDTLGVESYHLLPRGVPGDPGRRIIEELRAFEAVRLREESLTDDPRYPFYQAIYVQGLRSTRELFGTGFTKAEVQQAAKSGLLLAYGTGGSIGNSYRVNFLPTTLDN